MLCCANFVHARYFILAFVCITKFHVGDKLVNWKWPLFLNTKCSIFSMELYYISIKIYDFYQLYIYQQHVLFSLVLQCSTNCSDHII